MTSVAHRWTGQGVAPGAAVAGSWRADRPLPAGAVHIGPDDVEAAFAAVAADLDRVAERVRAQGRTAAADIVAVGALIAADPDLVDSAKQAAGADPPLPAVHDAVEGYATILDSLPDDALRQRAADVRQVGRRVLERLAYPGGGRGAPDDRFVLVAGDLGPADLIEHLGAGLVGAVAVRGGANSHAAIVARSVGIPLVMGIDAEVLDLPDATDLLVDADAGAVVAEPSADEVARTDAATARAVSRRAALAAERGLPHVTADDQAFALYANVASDVEVRLALDSGAIGSGLVRTELPFLEADRWPSEADHRRTLAPLLAEARGRPVTVRLLDFANDKIPQFLSPPAGLPTLLANPDAVTAQVRAIIDLGRDVGLRIMVPMVSSPAQLAPVREAVAAAAAALGVPPPPVGAMIETIAAVRDIDAVCQVVDFVSIGSNDLTAEVLDLSRVDPRARTELAAHPRVLSLIGRVVDASVRAGLPPLTVCGDAGSHPTTLPLLFGAGVRAVSVAVARIDETRWRLRRLDTGQCRALFTDALRLGGAADVAELVEERIEVAMP
ncbi:PEP-utilizing enzyme [Asanoa sp. WMMD1127]|uniref:putative PEP-binding protein n=1 Tax=Asanoa sp. WMMD1127 TaxID=3016107 RepID=UPI0024177074|nr:putative PEP-binding protein [Asanoa sp. WMMD1127]MDG4820537.1 PEP-utilizing enzyme [Asanoa sp. WMMD1127]